MTDNGLIDESFEKWWNPALLPEQAPDKLIRLYAEKAWKAARKHYAQKLTEAEAVKIATIAYAQSQRSMGYGLHKVEENSPTWKSLMSVILSLSASGIRFADDIDVVSKTGEKNNED